jgi:hypothetical protein
VIGMLVLVANTVERLPVLESNTGERDSVPAGDRAKIGYGTGGHEVPLYGVRRHWPSSRRMPI